MWALGDGAVLKPSAVRALPDAVRDSDDFKYSLSIQGGEMNGKSAVGPLHPSVLGTGSRRLVAGLRPLGSVEAAWLQRRLPVVGARRHGWARDRW